MSDTGPILAAQRGGRLALNYGRSGPLKWWECDRRSLRNRHSKAIHRDRNTIILYSDSLWHKLSQLRIWDFYSNGLLSHSGLFSNKRSSLTVKLLTYTLGWSSDVANFLTIRYLCSVYQINTNGPGAVLREFLVGVSRRQNDKPTLVYEICTENHTLIYGISCEIRPMSIHNMQKNVVWRYN